MRNTYDINFKSPVLIAGIERSGCGIVSRLLEGHGIWTGSTTGTGENKRLKGLMNAYYNFLGKDLKRQYPIPDLETLYIDPTWANRVQDCICTEGYQGEKWLYKSSALLQTYPLWIDAFPDAVWVVVQRDEREIIHSCLHTGHMIAFSDKKIQEKIGVLTEKDGWRWWHDQHQRMIETLKQRVQVIEVYPADFKSTKTITWFLERFGIVPHFGKCSDIQRLIKKIDHEDGC